MFMPPPILKKTVHIVLLMSVHPSVCLSQNFHIAGCWLFLVWTKPLLILGSIGKRSRSQGSPL